MKKFLPLLIVFVLFLSYPVLADDEARLLRFPTIYQDQIVFTYAGDLYTVSSEGGIARKLTNHVGMELFPRFSHDGEWLAFTGQYDGNTEVYMMPARGGVPKRLTYTATLGRDDVSDRMGPNNIVFGWKHKNDEIVFRSRMKSYNSFNGQLYLVSTKATLPDQIPVPRGGFASFSPDDKKMAYNRIFREFRTWKRYRGGMADDVWVYDFKTNKIENVTNNPAQDIIPMWKGNKIYFLSDRGDYQRMNLYVYDLTTKQTRQLTNLADFDIKFPSLGNKAIVFEYGGFIYSFDLQTEQAKKVSIKIADDMVNSRKEIKDVSKNVSNYEISPDAKRALFGARGDVFTVPAEHGPTRNLTATPGIHERNSKWSPNGKWIAYISDATGEDEIYLAAQDGKGKPIQLTKGGETYKYQPYWSPDSKKLLWGDRRQRLRYINVETKKIKDVLQSKVWEIRDYSWSPDSKWIVYTNPEEKVMNKIYLYSLEKDKSFEVTDGWYSANSPKFSSDGKYLFFVSNRDFRPVYSWTEWNHAYQDMSKIYFVTLNKKVESPFKPKSDEVKIKTEEKKSDKKKKDDKKDKSDKKKESVEVKVDVDGLKDRIAVLPIKASAYGSLASVGDNLYYTRRGSKDTKRQLLLYDLKKQKETELGAIGGYEISADAKKMLVSQNRTYAIIDLPKGKIKLDKKLNLSDMQVDLNKKKEWAQIYEESWRQMREFFFAPNMHGVDWEAIKKKYQPLVKYVNHRVDLTYIIGEMIGELNVGHTYVGGGDWKKAKRIQTGLLGAKIEQDKSGYFRIKEILRGQNWVNSMRSPLTEIGVGVNEGDYILAINGKPTKKMKNIFPALVNTVGKQVTLKVNSSPAEKGSRDVVVKPVADESNLYYFDWVQNNINKVDKATNGKVGYVHVPDMGVRGLNEFVKYFYPQLRKKALIIDVRGNGGGNVSPMIIERLRREVAMITMARNRTPGPNPGAQIWGPKVCLIDEFSASDGDIFPYRFKKHGLGKLIGKRTWGGVVGIRGSLPLLDGGDLRKPEFSRYDVEGKEWIMEGVGVEPDIYVDNDPYQEFIGNDQQLNKAIEVILEELKTKEQNIPPVPDFPDKSGKPMK